MPHARSTDGRTVVALIATLGREELLLDRAIPSILRQDRLPNRLVVVVDQARGELSDDALEAFGKRIAAKCDGALRLTVRRNLRTPRRAAGAWNVGIDVLHRSASLAAKPDLCFVAILDDDDSWEPDHLSCCLERAVTGDLAMVASGLIRHEDPGDAGHRHSIPQHLDPREQFIRGQHIQGSNLFVRLDALLMAGGFDEHLPSCTDRDLCIRLHDTNVRFGCTDRHTVHHFAEPSRDRMSSPASPTKRDGLYRFWRKHARRFDPEARRQAAERAAERFSCKLPPPPDVAAPVQLPPIAPSPHPVSLVAGLVTDGAAPVHVRGLLEDLLDLVTRVELHVVVVENGPLLEPRDRTLRLLIDDMRSRGLDVDLITIERQREDWTQGLLIDTPDPTAQRLPIAVTRTILNTYVAREAERHPGAWAWILDDDKRLDLQVDRGDGTNVTRPSPDLAALCALQDAGVDVVIGPDTGAAPLPFTATLRIQLVDLLHHLQLLRTMGPDDEWIDTSADDVASRRVLQDCYYDLSRHTEHLETPFAIPPAEVRRTARDVVKFISTGVDRLLAGVPVFRPLMVDARALGTDQRPDSIYRGGSTIFFDPHVLLQYPQSLARIGDRYVRRSDMLVSQLMRDQLGLKIVMHPAAGVRHDRSGTRQASLDDETLRIDVLGYAVYRAADEVMSKRTEDRRREPLLAWSADELKSIVGLVKKYTDERLAALTLSGWRIAGLAEGIRRTALELGGAGGAWAAAGDRACLGAIAREMDRISGNFRPNAMASFAEGIRTSVRDSDTRNTFLSMDGLISEYRSTRLFLGNDDHAMILTRERRARAIVKRVYGIDALRLLGVGGEGVVLTDEQSVFKVFDLMKRRPNHDTPETLRRLGNRLDQPRHLYPITRVETPEETLIVVYPYEPTEPYAGGRGAEIVGLLQECKANGIVFRNMHPKNLRVAAAGLKLVDYGSDVRAWSDSGYRSMAERAWLTWRWPHRADLDQLMRRALTDKSLAELTGFDRFWAAVAEESPSATRMVAGIVDPLILGCGARSVLDYGCGKEARSARHFAAAGLSTVGFDPGSDMESRWRGFGVEARLELTTDRAEALRRAPFDAVVCSLVLCEIGDGPEYEQILRDLGATVQEGGTVVVTLCDPLATFGEPTALHRHRELPRGATYTDRFWYSERAETDTLRREFHRPLDRIERDLLRHGLRVEQRLQSTAVDVSRFERASDFVTLICRPVPVPGAGKQVSLVIKTCAMEAHTIERQVEHLVRQLEGPHVFHERLLAVDSLRDGFVRQYAPADPQGLAAAAERLLARGVIDRVVEPPTRANAVQMLNREWFGIESAASHTESGAPLATPLHAFESCTGDYILQVDSDLLIGRSDRAHDYLGEMMAAIGSSEGALTVSLNVARTEPLPFSSAADGRPWRVEARGCLFHRSRLLAARPFPNDVVDGRPRLSWHRAMDAAAERSAFASLRGGGCGTYFVHPPNDFKRSVADWMLLLDLVERGQLPEEQHGKVDLVGGPLQWLPRDRPEPYVFVITGRNVPPGRALRCLDSLLAQRRRDWGAILVDDGSAPWTREHVSMAAAPLRDRITLVQPRERRGQMANMALAIRHICTNPASVIVTLDLDDALLGPAVVDRVAAECDAGADVTVGSMLRTDKHVAYPVDFERARIARGGNVWQHLRAFRKALFDAIPDQDLRIDGRYVDLAVDWAFMLPIVEMARNRVWIRDPLYLYEPSGMGKGADRDARERQIGAIIAKPARRPRDGARLLLSCAEDVRTAAWPEAGGILFLRHAHRPSLAGLDAAQREALPLTERGRDAALELGRAVGKSIRLVSSPLTRSLETAEAIAEAAGLARSDVTKADELVRFRIADDALYDAVKARLGWAGLMTAWVDGSLPAGTLIPCHEVAALAIGRAQALADDGRRVVAVTHDFMIIALLAAVHGVRTTKVPYLGGVLVTPDQARSLSNAVGGR